MDANELKLQCEGRWFGIYREFGISVGTHRENQACPVCGGTDRFRISQDGASYVCHQCDVGTGDGITLIMRACGINFNEAIKQIAALVGTTPATKVPQRDEAQIKKNLNELWNSGIPLDGSDAASPYLRGRSITLTPQSARLCAECYNSEKKYNIPALVSRIVDKDGRPVSLHRTYICESLKTRKKVMPAVKTISGCAIRLAPAKGDLVGIAEGIETAISATQLFDIPCWAAISAGGLEAMEFPEQIRRVVIFADNDKNFVGQHAAYSLARKLYRQNIIVSVEIPKREGEDWNDVLRNEATQKNT